MGQVDILRGPSGCGKSTWIKKEVQRLRAEVFDNKREKFDCAFVSADHFFDKGDGYKFNPKLLGLAHADCMKRFLEALLSKTEHIFVDNTATRVWEFENYVLAAEVAGYSVCLIEFQAKSEQIPLLVQRNNHKVPESAIVSMIERFEDYERFKVGHVKVEVRGDVN